MNELEQLLADLEAVPDFATREKARAAVRAVLELHGKGLERIRDLLAAKGQVGWAVLHECAQDPLVGSLLVLHDVHPATFETRVNAALQKVETFLRLNHARVDVQPGELRSLEVRIEFNPQSCRTSPERLKSALEQALTEAVPDAMQVNISLSSVAT